MISSILSTNLHLGVTGMRKREKTGREAAKRTTTADST